MQPVLFELGPLEVHSWGVMAALAFAASWYVLKRELERRCGSGDAAYPVVLAAAAGGLVGARGYWFIEHVDSASLTDGFSGAGFTWYGGVIGGAAGALLVARLRRVPLALLLGAAAPALALGYAIGRIGCQLAGDGTYGIASNLPWAMSYPNGEVPTTELVHPTPIYESLASLAIFWVLWRRRERWTPVRLFGLYLVLSGLERLLVEFIRRNEEVILGLTQPQLFAAGAAAAGALLLLWQGQPRPARADAGRASVNA
jgi:phosphatidylglycerol---prolipoprotein diacylglyceryl transferase